ncbi:MAG: hypothetical protein OXE73_10080 [Gammaproteobacteria bacterium]|nr:hypothetical protein [Gammaproteobacteria bacterium]
MAWEVGMLVVVEFPEADQKKLEQWRHRGALRYAAWLRPLLFALGMCRPTNQYAAAAWR